MTEPLAIEDIAGLSISMMGVLVRDYVHQGYADPTMYQAVRASIQLAQQYKARVELDGADPEVVSDIEDMIVLLETTAMETGEMVNKIIEEHGFPIDKTEWSE